MSLTVIQTCLPDYRLPFFEQLRRVLPSVELLCGQEYFTPSLSLCTLPAPWRTYVKNRFLLKRNFLWQVGVLKRGLGAEVLFVEFNPRILSSWVLLILRKLRGRPTVFWGHLWGRHGPVWFSRNVRFAMLKLSDGYIGYTHSQRKACAELLPNLQAWAAPNSCVARAFCEPLEYPADRSCIVYVGRLIEDKKPGLLLEAFAQALPNLAASTKLLLVGDGPERERLRNRAAELGLAARVEMPGHIGDESGLREIYRRAAVAVSSGYVGLSAIQCMALGVPLVVSRDELHSPELEACVEGKTCEFFETDNATKLAAKLVAFCAPDSPWRTVRTQLSAFIRENYTYEGMAEAFRTVSDHFVGAGKTGTVAPKVALVWAQYGPYHWARFKALRNVLGEQNVRGVEIANKSIIYGWTREGQAGEATITTLLPGKAAEEVSSYETFRAARRVFQLQQCSVVFVPSYWPASSLAVNLAARAAGAKVVMMNETHAHTAKARGLLALAKEYSVRQFAAALVGGQPHREYFAELGLSRAKIALGYDAVDNDYYSKASDSARADAGRLRARHGLPGRYFLNVGRMVWKKNLTVLIDAYKLVRDRLGTECPRLALVGGGNQEALLRERCFAHGLAIYECKGTPASPQRNEADVLFLGFRQIDELPEFYALAEAFILPSRLEEWGLVVNEAMACGLPVLVSKVAGCARDLVQPGVNGYLFDPFDAGELANELETIARNPFQAAEMGLASRRIIADWGCDRFAAGAQEAIVIALQKE